MAVRRAHHGNLDALIAQSSDPSGPFSFDRGPAFELKAELAKEINRPSEVIDDDPYVVHPFERHVSNLQDVIWSDNGLFLATPKHEFLRSRTSVRNVPAPEFVAAFAPKLILPWRPTASQIPTHAAASQRSS